MSLTETKRMIRERTSRTFLLVSLVWMIFWSGYSLQAAPKEAIFNVKDYGATGKKSDNVQAAIQKAIEACASAGGGTVYLPPGEYTSGQLRLRSHVRLYIEAFALRRRPAEHWHRRPGSH